MCSHGTPWGSFTVLAGSREGPVTYMTCLHRDFLADAGCVKGVNMGLQWIQKMKSGQVQLAVSNQGVPCVGSCTAHQP